MVRHLDCSALRQTATWLSEHKHSKMSSGVIQKSVWACWKRLDKLSGGLSFPKNSCSISQTHLGDCGIWCCSRAELILSPTKTFPLLRCSNVSQSTSCIYPKFVAPPTKLVLLTYLTHQKHAVYLLFRFFDNQSCRRCCIATRIARNLGVKAVQMLDFSNVNLNHKICCWRQLTLNLLPAAATLIIKQLIWMTFSLRWGV